MNRKRQILGLIIVQTIFLFLFTGFVIAEEAKNPAPAAAEKKLSPEMGTVLKAQSLMDQGNFEEARELLKQLISQAPADWKPASETPEKFRIAFWDLDEFKAFIQYGQERGTLKKNVEWIGPSYSKAFYQLALMDVEQKNYEEALKYLDQALALEPDQPYALCEKAFVFSRMGKYQDAYELYKKALDVRPWASTDARAKALRGQGNVLIDLNRLDDAEKALKESLKVEPNNPNAINELGYIDDLRKGKPTN